MPEDVLTVATVLYGGAETLSATLPTWAASASGLPVRFLFIDNSEEDSARSVVESQSWRSGTMTYVRSGTNVGFAAAANRAISEATTPTVFLLNADVTLRAGALEAIIAMTPVRGPVAVSLVTNGEIAAGVHVNPLGWFSDRPLHSSTPCLGPSGGAAVFDRAQFLETGGFTDELFAWGEDAALALRMWAAGIRTSTMDLRLDHSGGHSVASVAGLRRKAFWLARNRVWILRAQYSLPYRLLVGPPLLVMLALNGARKIRAGTAGAYFSGIRAGVTTRPPWTVQRVMTLGAHLDYLRRGGRTAVPANRSLHAEGVR